MKDTVFFPLLHPLEEYPSPNRYFTVNPAAPSVSHVRYSGFEPITCITEISSAISFNYLKMFLEKSWSFTREFSAKSSASLLWWRFYHLSHSNNQTTVQCTFSFLSYFLPQYSRIPLNNYVRDGQPVNNISMASSINAPTFINLILILIVLMREKHLNILLKVYTEVLLQYSITVQDICPPSDRNIYV